MDEVIVFVSGAPTIKYSSGAVDRYYYHNLFIPNGISRLVIVNSSSDFKGVVSVLYKIFSLPAPWNTRRITDPYD